MLTTNIDLCDNAEKKQIEEYMVMSLEDMEKKIEEFEAQLEATEERFEMEVRKLQAAYQQLVEDKDVKLAAIKDSGLGILKAVKHNKAKAVRKDEL